VRLGLVGFVKYLLESAPEWRALVVVRVGQLIVVDCVPIVRGVHVCTVSRCSVRALRPRMTSWAQRGITASVMRRWVRWSGGCRGDCRRCRGR
jgi:hypothetical protein